MMTDAFVLGGVRTPFAQLTPRWSMNRSRNDTWTDPIPTMAHGDAPLTLARQKESTVPTTASEGLDLQRPGRTAAGIGTRAKLAMFIFVATNTVRHGMLSQERRRAPKWVDYIDLHEPRLIAFLEYLSEDGTEVEYVQIHPDAASFEHHLQVLADAETSYQDTLEATTAIRIYGTPTEQIMTTLRRSVGPDVQITILPTLLGGFSRR